MASIKDEEKKRKGKVLVKKENSSSASSAGSGLKAPSSSSSSGSSKNSSGSIASVRKSIGTQVSAARKQNTSASSRISRDPTETEMLAHIMKVGESNDEEGRRLYGLYGQAKEQGHWKETYDKATSPYLTALGITDPSQINDDFFAANSHLYTPGVHTATGALSSAKRNGPEAMLAYNLSGLQEDYYATKEMQAEQNQMVAEARYWMDKGLTDEEIKKKLNIGGTGSKYTKIGSAMERSAKGEFTPTTAPIWAATSWGVDGMLWSLRNPDQATGDYFTDAIKRDMGQGKAAYTDTTENIARRTPGSATWAPYSNGTTMDKEAILFGVSQFDQKWLDDNRQRILASGDQKMIDAFGKVWEAEQKTQEAEEQAAYFREEMMAAIEMGSSPDEIFKDGFLNGEEYDVLRELLNGYMKGSPAAVTRSVDFDIASLYKMAQDEWAKKNGTLTTDEYEAALSEATGGSYMPDPAKQNNFKIRDMDTNILLPQYAPVATTGERQAFRMIANAGYSDVVYTTGNMVANGTGGAVEMHEALKKSAFGFANENYFNAMNAISNGGRNEVSYLSDGSLEMLNEMFPEIIAEGRIPTSEDYDAYVEANFNTPEALMSFEKQQMDQMWIQMQGDLERARANAEGDVLAADEAQKTLDKIYKNFANAYGEDTDQYRAAIATYEYAYDYAGGVPKQWNAYDSFQLLSENGPVEAGAANNYLLNARGANARDMLVLQAAITNAQTLGLPENIIENMTQQLDDLKTQNELLGMHKLSQNKDFASQVGTFDQTFTAYEPEGFFMQKPTHEDVVRFAIIDPDSAVPLGAAEQSDTVMLAQAMTADEKSIYKYIYMTAGPEKATEYFDMLSENLYVRSAQQRSEAMQEWAGDNPINAAAATVGSIALTPVEAFSSLGMLIGKVKGDDINPFGPEFWATRAKGDLRTGVKEGIEQALGDEYKTANSIISTLYDAITGAGDNLLTASTGSAWSASALMALSGMNSAVMDASMRGATDEQALWYGIANAAIEFGTEKIGMDNIIKAFSSGGADGVRGMLTAMMENFGSEFGEEFIGGAAGSGVDAIIMKGLSNREAAIAEYEALGLSREEAVAQAYKDVLTDALYGGLVGGLSGGISAGAGYVGGWILGNESTPEAEPAAPVEKATGTQQERAVAAIANANVTGVGEANQTATIAGVFTSFGMEAEEGTAASKNIVKNGEIQHVQDLMQETNDPAEMAAALTLGYTAPSSRTAAALNDGADAQAVVDAYHDDVQDEAVMAEYDAALTQSMEADATAQVLSTMPPVDTSKKDAANTAVQQGQEKVDVAQAELKAANDAVARSNEMLKQNPTDPGLAQKVRSDIQKRTQAQKTAASANRELATLKSAAKKVGIEFKTETERQMAAAREQAKQIVAQRKAEMAQKKAMNAELAEQQRQEGNVAALETDDFIATQLEGANLTEEERQKVAGMIQERKPIQSLDNTEGSGARAKFIAQMQKKFGVRITITDTTKGGTAMRYNGFYDAKTDSIVIDSQATQSDVIYGVLLHEITHRAERSNTYTEFANAILKIKYGDNADQLARDIKAKQDSYNARLKAMAELDSSVGATPLTADGASKEIVADLTREILYGDEASIQKLVAEQPSVARRMLETIKNFINKLRGVNDPAVDQLNKARGLFEKALGSVENGRVDSGKQYQMFDSHGKAIVLSEEEIEANKRHVANQKPIVALKGNPFSKNDEKDFETMAMEYLQKTGDTASSPIFGDVRIGLAGIQHLISQKLTWRKAALLPAVKSVIEEGKILYTENNHKGKGYDTALLGSVVSLDGEEYYMGVVVRQTAPDDNSYYMHDAVVVQKNRASAPNKSGQGKNPAAGSTNPTIASILASLANFNSKFQNSEIPQTDSDESNAGQQVEIATESEQTAKQEIKTNSGEVAAEIIRGGATKQYSLASWTEEERKTVRKTLINKGYGPVDVDKWISDVDSVAATIANDKARLDYTADPDMVMLKNNEEYVKTLDASTLCAKRLLYQGTFNEIQHLLPNTPLTSDMLLDLLNMMKDAGYESPCAVCYVESRRRHLGKFAEQWLHGRPKTKDQEAWQPYSGEYIPTLDELTTTDGLAKLKKEHPQAYNNFMKKMRSLGSSNPKIVELRTDYRGDIRKMKSTTVDKVKKIGGLRVQSFSDFETPHLIDMMQAVLDMSGKKLTSQAYTKVPNFAWVFGDTGIKINLSLLAEGSGLDENGNLIFSSSEGMDFEEAMRLRERYSQNVGTILVGVSEPHIRAAMADPRIDYIIPFHRSGWGKNELKKVSVLQPYDDFQSTQNERWLDGSKIETGNIYPIDYWDYSKTGDENAATYLKLCEEDGRIPKFEQFLTKDENGHWMAPSGYWKMLIDFKMYDNDGNGAPQQVVQPNFNMEEAERVLGEYQGGADTLPVAYDIVDRYVAEYKAANPGVQYSLPSENVLGEMVDNYHAQNNMQNADQNNRPQGERQFAAQTMPNTDAVPEWIWREFQSRPGELNYDIDTNREQVERGWQRIQQNGHDAELDRLMESDRFSADDTAEANLMMAMALRNEDPATFMALASKYNKEGTEAGKELQARKLFSKMSPTGARIWVAGKLENQLSEYMRTHRPKKQQIDRRAEQVADEIRNLEGGDMFRLLREGGEITLDSTNNRFGVPINQQQQALIDHYNLNNVSRPGIFYNRATTQQRMLEAILATPNPLQVTGNGLNLIQRLEFMADGEAVITNADLDYIGARLAEFVGAGAEAGGREADVAVARAYEAFGNITPATRGEKARTWRYVAMLTSIPSAIRNVIGNASQNLVSAAAHGIAVEIDKAVARATGARTVEHLNMQERVEGWRAFAEETKNTFRDYFVDRVTTQRGDDKYNTNQRGRVYQTQALEAVRNVEGFLMSFGDRNMWRKAYINSLSEQQKLADQGLLYNDDGTTRTNEQMIEQAEMDANYATFTEDNRVSDILGQLKRVPGIGTVLDFIMPFTRVPANITRRMIQYSPVGLVTTAYTAAARSARGDNFNQQAFVNGLARGLTGTAMFGVGMLLAQMGAIKLGTGEEEDKKKYGLQTAMGQQYTPYIYNPFTDEYVSLAVFSPAASALTMGAAAWADFKDNDDAIQALQNAAFGSIDQIFDASYMSGLSDLFGGYGSFGENLRDTLLDNVISQNVPTIIGQLANAIDPYVRDTKHKNSIMQSLNSGIINKIPFLRQAMLPVKVDVTGQPVRTKEGLRNFYDPFTTTDARNEPVVDELFRLNEALGSSIMLPSDALSGTKDTLTINSQKVTLDGAGKEAYRKRYGELWMEGGKTVDKKGVPKTVEGLRDLMASNRYKLMDDEEKAKTIKGIIDAAKVGASMEALMKYGANDEE